MHKQKVRGLFSQEHDSTLGYLPGPLSSHIAGSICVKRCPIYCQVLFGGNTIISPWWHDSSELSMFLPQEFWKCQYQEEDHARVSWGRFWGVQEQARGIRMGRGCHKVSLFAGRVTQAQLPMCLVPTKRVSSLLPNENSGSWPFTILGCSTKVSPIGPMGISILPPLTGYPNFGEGIPTEEEGGRLPESHQ